MKEMHPTSSVFLINTKKMQKEIIKKWQDFMDQNDITQAELARRLKFDKSQLSRYFNTQTNMSLDRFFEISKALGCDQTIHLQGGGSVTITKREKL